MSPTGTKGPTFSPGSIHQPGLKVATPFSPGSCLEPGQKGPDEPGPMPVRPLGTRTGTYAPMGPGS